MWDVLVGLTSVSSKIGRTGLGVPREAPAEAVRRKTADLTDWVAAPGLGGDQKRNPG